VPQDDLARPETRSWTRPDDYFEALARRRTARRNRGEHNRRTQPEAPRVWLSTIPFLALIAALGGLAIAIMVAAWPGRPLRHPPPRQPEQGIAAKGWFQKAQREFR
jgi:anti-sigma factor RsiW